MLKPKTVSLSPSTISNEILPHSASIQKKKINKINKNKNKLINKNLRKLKLLKQTLIQSHN